MPLGRFELCAAVFFVASCFSFADVNGGSAKFGEFKMQVFNKCSRENNLSKDLGLKVLRSIFKYDPIPVGPGVKCYFACHLRECGLVSSDGSILGQKFAQFVKPEFPDEDYPKLVQAIDTCLKTDTKSGDLCQTGYDFNKCFFDILNKLNVTHVSTDAIELKL